MTEIICKRCLLKDLTDDDKFRTIYEYIESLPKESRATPKVERCRLAFCMKCEHLIYVAATATAEWQRATMRVFRVKDTSFTEKTNAQVIMCLEKNLELATSTLAIVKNIC